MLLIHLILRKRKITGQTAADNNDGNILVRVYVEIMVQLKYLSNFGELLECL